MLYLGRSRYHPGGVVCCIWDVQVITRVAWCVVLDTFKLSPGWRGVVDAGTVVFIRHSIASPVI